MREEWPIWRLVFAEEATLSEIDHHYTVADIAKANEVLTARLEAEAALAQRQRARAEAARAGRR